MQSWLDSGERQRLIEKVQPLLVSGDRYTVRSGLEFLFTSEAPAATAPVRWKQWLVTWSVIYPLVLGVPVVLAPLMRALGLPDNPYLGALMVTGTIVGLMVYVVMPRYTRLVHAWLFRGPV